MTAETVCARTDVSAALRMRKRGAAAAAAYVQICDRFRVISLVNLIGIVLAGWNNSRDPARGYHELTRTLADICMIRVGALSRGFCNYKKQIFPIVHNSHMPGNAHSWLWLDNSEQFRWAHTAKRAPPRLAHLSKKDSAPVTPTHTSALRETLSRTS